MFHAQNAHAPSACACGTSSRDEPSTALLDTESSSKSKAMASVTWIAPCGTSTAAQEARRQDRVQAVEDTGGVILPRLHSFGTGAVAVEHQIRCSQGRRR